MTTAGSNTRNCSFMAWIPLSSVLGEYSFSLMKQKRLMALESKGATRQKEPGLESDL
jgi:hypothetical protein